MNEPQIENGFAKVGAGTWLVGTSQPTAVIGNSTPRSLKGWLVPDRSKLHLVEVTDRACCGAANRPFLTQVPCAAPLVAVSAKVLLAPVEARQGAKVLRVIPFSFRNALCVTKFASEWVVLATSSRTTRVSLKENELLTVRVESAVAWTTQNPTGFMPRIGLWDILIPRQRDRNLMLHFYGPGVVWVEGSDAS
ncbi:MAG: hypothetical protein II943_02690 [Victivallales bacterium]|nr:hypothetical protein [Victivallales bacterium]